MSTFKRFLPFLKPYVPRMLVAGVLVMAVAAINLALLRLAGMLWDVITVQHDDRRMTQMIAVFLGLVLLQGLCSMGHSYLTAWVSQHIVADFRRHLFAQVADHAGFVGAAGSAAREDERDGTVGQLSCVFSQKVAGATG